MDSKKSLLKDFLQRNVPWVILVAQCIFFGIITDNFFTARNIVNILNQNAFVIVTALGVTLVMMSGSFDISIGQQMSVIGVVSGILLTKTNAPIPIVFVAAILMGIAMNALSAFVAHALNLTHFIVSVAAMNIYMGLSFTISGGSVSPRLPDSFRVLGQGFIGPAPTSIIVAAIFFVIMSVFLTRTYWGRYIYALGGNVEASRLAGINVLGTRLMIACICGFFVGLASLMLIARVGAAQSVVGPGTEFLVITGVLVGGVSLRGGEGKLHGVLAGVLIMAIFANGMQMANMGVYAQLIVRGFIMIAAIALDFFQYSRRQRIHGTRRKNIENL